MRRPAAGKPQAAEKIRFLEGMRGLAALYVVLGHLCSMADPSRLAGVRSNAPEWLQWLMAPFAYGHLAVAAFIVISGFCLQLSLYNTASGRIKTLGSFFVRRARRILPPYYACLAFSLLVSLQITQFQIGMPFEQYVPVTWPNTLAHVFLVHNLWPDWMYKINGVLWSIGLEVQLYLVFPALVLLIRKYGRMGVLVLTCIAAGLVLFAIPGSMKLYPWYLVLFTLGMVSAHFSHRPNLKIGTVPGLGLMIGWPAIAACVWASAQGKPMWERDLWLGLGLACLIYVWTVRPSFRLAKGLSWGPMVSLGGFSYSLYLMHHPIQQVLYVHRPAWATDAASDLLFLTAFALPAILVACYAFSLVFEQPFVARKRPAQTRTRWTVPLFLPLRPYRRVVRRPVKAVVQIEPKDRKGQTARAR